MTAGTTSSGATGARVGIAATLVLVGAGLARAFGGPLSWYPVTLGAAALLIGAGYQRINPKLRTTSVMLFVLGLLALPFARDPLLAIQRGVFVAGMLIALTAGVLLIAHCAMQSDRIHAIGAALRQRQGRARYLAFALVSQFFSGVLGLAGANLMFIMAAPSAQARDGQTTPSVVAVARGFAAASCWSPVFGSMAILLALYPTLHWIQVFPVGLGIGQLTILVGALMFRADRRPAGPTQHSATAPGADPGIDPTIDPPIDPSADLGADLALAPAEAALPLGRVARDALPLVLSLLAFFVAMIVVSAALHVIVTAALVMLAPLVSLLFHAATGQPGRRGAAAVRGLGHGVRLFPTLASEAVLFIAAGCAGSIMADAFPASWVLAIGQALGGHHFFGHLFLLLAIMAAALTGIHPVLSGVFLASTMTPAVLGLPPLTHMAAILAGWGLSSAVAPFSVLSLTASRYAGEGLVQISLLRNGLFAVTNAFVICGLLAACVEFMELAE